MAWPGEDKISFRLLAKIKKHINIYPHTYTILITCIIPEGKSEIDIRSRLETRYRMRLISRSVNTGNTVILAGQSSAVAIKCVCEEDGSNRFMNVKVNL